MAWSNCLPVFLLPRIRRRDLHPEKYMIQFLQFTRSLKQNIFSLKAIIHILRILWSINHWPLWLREHVLADPPPRRWKCKFFTQTKNLIMFWNKRICNFFYLLPCRGEVLLLSTFGTSNPLRQLQDITGFPKSCWNIIFFCINIVFLLHICSSIIKSLINNTHTHTLHISKYYAFQICVPNSWYLCALLQLR